MLIIMSYLRSNYKILNYWRESRPYSNSWHKPRTNISKIINGISNTFLHLNFNGLLLPQE